MHRKLNFYFLQKTESKQIMTENEEKHSACSDKNKESLVVSHAIAFDGQPLLPNKTNSNMQDFCIIVDSHSDSKQKDKLKKVTIFNTCENCGQELNKNVKKSTFDVEKLHSSQSSFSNCKQHSSVSFL